MINLLFISNYPKIDTLKDSLKSLLRLKIDVVEDFDYGLKDVFEKRPVIVFIQEQISGVTGESVARHIQMLLGAAAPTFIFMHEGNTKARPLKGLYEHLVDISLPDDKLKENIQEILKTIFGPKWEQVFIPPKVETHGRKTALAAVEDNRIIADQIVDDFISDLEKTAQTAVARPHPLTDFAALDSSQEESFRIISTPQDQLADIQSETDREPHESESPMVPTQVTLPENGTEGTVPTVSDKQPPPPSPPGLHESSDLRSTKVGDSLSAKPDFESTDLAAPADHSSVPPVETGPTKKNSVSMVSPADFRIRMSGEGQGEKPPTGPLTVIDARIGTRQSARSWLPAISIIVLMALAGGVWYLVTQKQHQVRAVANTPVASTNSPHTASIQDGPKPSSAPQRPAHVSLPSFIPPEGLDPSYASQHPGWERYVGADSEFRVFLSNERLRAVQVIASRGRFISDSSLKSMLVELTGSGHYRESSREQKQGILIIHAAAGRNAELLIYQKQSTVQAVVISLE